MGTNQDRAVWRGVLIQESLDNNSLIPPAVHLIETKTSYLENEKHRGEVRFHNVEVNDSDQPDVIEQLENTLKPGWYCHLVKDDLMVVVFRGRHFEIKRGDRQRMQEVRQFGLSQGIIAEQMPFEHLIEHPFD